MLIQKFENEVWCQKLISNSRRKTYTNQFALSPTKKQMYAPCVTKGPKQEDIYNTHDTCYYYPIRTGVSFTKLHIYRISKYIPDPKLDHSFWLHIFKDGLKSLDF